MLTYRWFARQYGWTPDQVDELPIEAWEWLPLIEQAADDASRLRQNTQGRTGGHGRANGARQRGGA